ncbi:MAG: hypothetical protein R6V54_13840, partial [Desulfobacteraceae bacterium]
SSCLSGSELTQPGGALLILLFDIFLLLNRFLHLVSRPVIKKSRQQVKGLLIIVMSLVSCKTAR